jgi:hypothetical protein
MDEKTINVVRGNGFTQLLQRPVCRRMRSHIHVQDTTRRVFDDHKHIEDAEGPCDCDAEVTGDDRLGMIAHKR